MMRQIMIAGALMVLLSSPATALAWSCPYLVRDAVSYSVKKQILGILIEEPGGILGLTIELLWYTEQNVKIASETHRNTATTITKGFEAQTKELRNLFVEAEVAARKIDSFLAHGTPGRAPYVSCDEEQRVDVSIGQDNTAKATSAIAENISTFNQSFGDRRASMEAIRELPAAAASAENIFPSGNTLKTEGEGAGTLTNAVNWAHMVTNPYPGLTLDDEVKATPSGKEYEAVKKIKEASLAVPQLALSDIIANKTPSYELGQWATRMNEIMGRSAPPRGVVNGKISADALLDTLTDLRFSNPNWPIDIHTKSTQGLLRELLLIRSVHLEFKRRQMALMQHMTALVAVSTAKDIDVSGGLEQLRNSSISERIN